MSDEVKHILDTEIGALSPEDKKALGIKEPYTIYTSKGCDACNGKGISGRVAIFEMLQMTHELSEIVSKQPTENEIIAEAKRQHMITLRQDGLAKALRGLVSFEVIMRETEEF